MLQVKSAHPMAAQKTRAPLVIDTLKHAGATRKNIPTAECNFGLIENS
jgi:hypothetical protein